MVPHAQFFIVSTFPMLPSRFRTAALTLALAVAVTACGGAPQGQQQGPGQVTVVTLKTESVSLDRELPGRTAAFQVAEVRPQVSGIIARRLFVEGSEVKAGDPLYQIEDATYRASAASARAQVERASANAEQARLAARRIAELARINAVSAQENENAQAALKTAEADLSAARAVLQQANVTLGYARITSPIDGRIGKSTVTQGALVTANQEAALAVVNQLDPIYVDLTQSVSELMQLRRDMAAGKLQANAQMPVSILLEDGSTFAQQGVLESSEVSVDPATGSYGMRVKVDNPDGLLMPGMFVRAAIGTGTRQQALLVPMQGVQRDPKGNTTAMVVDAEGKVAVRPIQVSQTVGDKWLVEDGLAAGDKVIVEGLQKIGPGMPVNATEKGAEPAPTAAAPAAAPADAK